VRTMQVFLWTTFISVLLIQRSAGQMLEDDCISSLVSRIINGDNAEWEAAAWMAAIFNTKRFLCGGTVIHRRIILFQTCIINILIFRIVMLGAYNKTSPTQEYGVIRGLIHHGYSRRNMEHDIGLLKLSQDIRFGFDVYPICISLDPSIKSRVDNFRTFDAYGWGLTELEKESELLQKVRLYRKDRRLCDRLLRDHTLTSNQLCVGSWYGDTCGGDSGGPLTKNVTVNGDKLKIQLAIVSFGIRNCRGVGIYTDVSSYANWIDGNIKKYLYINENRLPGNPGTVARPRQAMYLYDECGGDDISLNMVVHIYGGKIPGKGVMITDRMYFARIPLLYDSIFFIISRLLPVESIIKHPDFSGDHNHDIALLKLARPPSLSGKRKPICMLLQARHRQRAANSTNFTIFDSRASNATSLKVHLFNSSECSTRIETEMEQDQLCIEEPEKEKEIKYGQAGDIMGIKTVYSDKDKFVLVGIVRYSSNGLIILTNVLEYTDWIAGIVTNE
ncbi:hypothetical protein KR059_005092, partial [Drosophila kikkawai]